MNTNNTKRLFIIGNGFDLAHGLPTQYKDFREWLIKQFDLKNGNVEKDKLSGHISQKYNFKHITDKLLENFNSGSFNDSHIMMSTKAEAASAFVAGVCQEWLGIQDGRVGSEINGKGETKKEALFDWLEKSNCKNLLKVSKVMGDEEFNQENLDKAMYKILNEEFEFDAIQKWSSSNCLNPDTITPKDIANIIVTTIDEATNKDWWQFEDKLGDLELYLDMLAEETDEIDDDYQAQIKKILYHGLLVTVLPHLNELFKKWIRTIDVNNLKVDKPNFRNRVDKDNDLFLNFNYTDTLVAKYGVKNVCQIHGNANKSQEIVLGHGKDADFSTFDDKAFVGTFKKITSAYITRNQDFFSSLKNITEIYSIGFSFGDVDLPYIKEICNNIHTPKITWYLSTFDEKKNDNDNEKKTKNDVYKEKIYKCGFLNQNEKQETLTVANGGCPIVEFDLFDLEKSLLNVK